MSNHAAVIGALWRRSLTHYFRSRAQMVAALGQPALYLFALGFGLGPVFARAGEGNYIQFIAPGIIGMTILFSSTFSGINLLWDRQFGFLKETLVAPVPRLDIMLGRTLGGATVAVIQGMLVLLVCLIAGFRPTSAAALPLALLYMVLIAIVFCALGTAIGSRMESMQAFPLVMNFLMMPLFFLSGALYPLGNLPTPLAIVTRLDPLSYGVDGLRGALSGTAHFPFLLDAGVLAGVAVLFLAFGAWSFSKIQL
ncbi:MAG: multidrug ABC transporter permease [Sphingomonadales bacterium]|nr:MAG: multidrug ABC transporter permease [Sphingomonadales bacterium]